MCDMLGKCTKYHYKTIQYYICSDRTMLYIYSDVMVGDYVLSAGRATDSGPGLHSKLTWSL